jgi:DNA helicase-2/ATP-dependent DNA helicase PcrA
MQLLPGVGPATAARLLDRIGEAPDVLQAIEAFAPPAAAAESWSSFAETIRIVGGGSVGWPAQL